jgi:Zn-dependent protease/CBS domain-containing protein
VFGASWRLGRIAGIEVRVDASWVVIALLITYSLYLQFTQAFPALSQPEAVVMAVVFSLLFFGSVLIHEMAHAVTARRRGIAVRGITLFLFGGATHAKVESKGPADEFVISVVGPLTSLVLGAAFFGLGLAIRDVNTPWAGGLLRLGLINGILAVFNMLPGFPLDGGRVLRSIVWRVTGNIVRATRVASIAGQVVGYLLIAAGVFFLAQGITVSAIWFAAIGWFLAQAARASYDEVQIRGLLSSVEAEDIMSPDLVRVPGKLTLREAVNDYFMRYDHGAFPVGEGERTDGLITIRAVRRVPQEEWDTRRVREVMDAVDEHLTVPRDARMDRVLAKLQDGERKRVLVMSNGEVVGIITPSDIARWLDRRKALSS